MEGFAGVEREDGRIIGGREGRLARVERKDGMISGGRRGRLEGF